ncbi:hypothetical protein BHE74_00057620 [Ensete ventricosum]|nr:hypothetical protein BHE74_00057620 [Ensete ventricosum]
MCTLCADESSPPMARKLRHDIAVGTAMGLHYLHKGCQRRIIHRDIKASNILLTANFEPQVASSTQLTSLLLLLSICTTNPSPPPQISDFGLARWLPTEWTHRLVARAPIEGTFRYELLENIHAGAQGLRCSQQLTKLVVSPGAWRRNTSCTGSFTRRPMWLHFASSSWRSCQEGNQWMDLTTACSAGSASAASDGHRDHYGTAIANFALDILEGRKILQDEWKMPASRRERRKKKSSGALMIWTTMTTTNILRGHLSPPSWTFSVPKISPTSSAVDDDFYTRSSASSLLQPLFSLSRAPVRATAHRLSVLCREGTTSSFLLSNGSKSPPRRLPFCEAAIVDSSSAKS